MTPKPFLVAAFSIALPLSLAFATPSARADEVTLEDNLLKVCFDSDTGALTRMASKTTVGETDWIIERRPELGVSFRLFAPLPAQRYNPVLGYKQHATEVKKVSDNEVELQWKDLASENGGVLPMTLTAHVTLNHGVLTFDATLQNDSSLTVETIDYPYFGDISRPSHDSTLSVVSTNGMHQEELYPHFGNQRGYWGVFFPIKIVTSAQTEFCLIQAPFRGIYIAPGDPAPKYRLEYTFEQHPGLISSITQLVPPDDDISGTPVHMEFRTCHFIFAPGHSTTQLSPIVMQCYHGDTRAGQRLYEQSHSNL